MLRFFRYWVPVVLWMAVIFLMSTNLGSAATTSRFVEPFLRWLIPSISPATIQQVHFWIRKSAHLGEYTALFPANTRLADVKTAVNGIKAAAYLP